MNLKTGKLFVNRSLTELKGGAVLEKPKTRNAYRYVKMAPELVSELRYWKLRCPPSVNGFVFANELGRPMNRKANNRMLKACCERAEVRPLNVNNLRHSFASQHLIAGTPVLKVSAMMGHSDPAVTLKVYRIGRSGKNQGRKWRLPAGYSEPLSRGNRPGANDIYG